MQRAVVTVVCEAPRDATISDEQSSDGEFHEHIHSHVDAFLLQRPNQLETSRISDMSKSGVSVAAEVALACQTLRRTVKHSPPLL